jgi:hypothetical protein
VLGREGSNLLLDFTKALLVRKGNSVKVLGVFLDQLCINPGGKKDMGLVVFPECARPVVQLAVKRLLDKDLLEDPLREVGCGIDEVLTKLMQMFLLGLSDMLFVLLELCHHLAARRERFGLLE